MGEGAGPGLRGQSRFELEYELDAADFAALLSSQQRVLQADRKPIAIRGIVVRIAVVLLIAAGAIVLGNRQIVEPVAVFAFGAGVCCTILAIFAYQAWYRARIHPGRMLQMNGLAGRPHRLVVDASGLHTRIPGSTAHYEWKMVERVDEAESHIFLWVSGLLSIVVPLRVFDSDEQRAAFLSAVKEWINVKV